MTAAFIPSSRTTISYRLLGSLAAFRADGDGDVHPLDLGPPKQRAVLAMLLLNRGRIVSTDQLTTAVWGEHPPGSALAGLQAYVSNLRRILRPAADASSPIVLRGPGYVLDADAAQLDTTGFAEASHQARTAIERERWADALGLADAALEDWGGAFLDDLRDEPWVQAEASAVEELRTDCRESQITALLALGRVPTAVAAAQKLRTEHPLRDRGCWLHMVALHIAGRSTEALDAYREHVAALDELGLEPGTELRELEVAVLRHDPELAAWPRRAGWTGAQEVATPEAPTPAAPTSSTEASAELVAGRADLIGRDHERLLIDQALTEARSGRTRWLLLTGPAGIGKTRLAEELVWRARPAGGQDAWARCSDEDGAPAWWPIRQIVRALASDPDAVLVPPPGVDADEARFTVYERVAALIEATARPDAPLVVVVDDVQWADRTSARCLAHLASALRTTPVVFALTLRDTEDQTAIEPLLASLARTAGRWQLGVGPLATTDVRALADRVAADPLTEAEAAALAERTGGNPLFVSEFARLPVEARESGDTPLAVRSVLGRRLVSVDEEVLAILRPAAVLGELIDLPALAGATGQDPDALADLLDLAADARLVVPATGTGGYAFAHALLRQELLDGMSAVRRQRWHARIAAALADTTDADRISQRARHLVAAGSLVEAEDVVDACRAAAIAAEDRWSADAAAGWWAEALTAFERLPSGAQDPEERDRMRIAQVEQFARAGRGQSVMEVIDAGMLEAMRNGRTETVGRLAASLVRSAGSWPWLAYGERPLAMLERLESVRTFVAGDPGASARVQAALAVGRCYDPDASIADGLSTRALELAEQAGTDDVIADAILGRMLAYSGVAAHAEECLELSARLERLEHPAAPVDRAIWRASASIALLTIGRVAEAEVVVAEAIAMSDAERLPIVRAQLRWMQGALDTWHGDLDGARRHHTIATRVHVASEIAYPGSVWLAEHGVHFVAGDLGGCDVSGSPEPDAWAAAIAAARGERDAVRDHAVAWLDALDAWTWITLGHLTLIASACADARLDDLAPRLLDLLAPYPGHIGSIGHTGMVGPIDLATGRLHALLGHRDRAEAHIRAALDLTERTGGVLYAARCRAALAAL